MGVKVVIIVSIPFGSGFKSKVCTFFNLSLREVGPVTMVQIQMNLP